MYALGLDIRIERLRRRIIYPDMYPFPFDTDICHISPTKCLYESSADLILHILFGGAPPQVGHIIIQRIHIDVVNTRFVLGVVEKHFSDDSVK